eukprot:371434_1
MGACAGALSSCCGGQEELDETTLKSRDNTRTLLDDRDNSEPAKYASQSTSDSADDTPHLLPNQSVANQTFDLRKDALALRKEYADKYRELLPRAFNIYRTYEESNDGVSVMQFNMLADGLSEAYTTVANDKSFVGVDRECLQWKYRGIKICEEITRFNADIVCLQECDQIEFLMLYLAPFGYMHYHHTIVDSPTQKVAKQLSNERKANIELPDYGIAILFKSDKFEINGTIQRIDRRENVVKVSGLAVPLKCRKNKKALLVITTHLKSKKTEKGEQISEKQICLLLNTLIQNGQKAAVILCCDLNGNP